MSVGKRLAVTLNKKNFHHMSFIYIGPFEMLTISTMSSLHMLQNSQNNGQIIVLSFTVDILQEYV